MSSYQKIPVGFFFPEFFVSKWQIGEAVLQSDQHRDEELSQLEKGNRSRGSLKKVWWSSY